MGFLGDQRSNIIKAKLDSGEIVTIDQASDTKNISKPENWEYLGMGVYHTINNTPQRGEKRCHFWKRNHAT